MASSSTPAAGAEAGKHNFGPHVYVHIKGDKQDVGIVTMHREPVNSMNLDLWQGLLDALIWAEKHGKIRALIFQSGIKRDVFSAGNDINELYSKSTNKERYHKFWVAQTTFLSRLYASPLFTLAAVRGQCPAGGCILALVCDYRVMTLENDPQIGLNEVALGISVPKFWISLLGDIAGKRLAETMVLEAKMLTSREAEKAGIIDKVVPTQQLLTVAEAEVRARLKLPDAGRQRTKLCIRSDFAKRWQDQAVQEATDGFISLCSPQATAALEGVLQRLSGGAAKKPNSKL